MYPFLLKSHIKEHSRHYKSGNVAEVHEYDKKDKAKQEASTNNNQRIAAMVLKGPLLHAEKIKIDSNDLKEITEAGEKYYKDTLLGKKVYSPALKEKVSFTNRGLKYIMAKEPAEQSRRFKLLPKVVQIIENVPIIDHNDIRKEGDGHYRYGLYGRFNDGSVVNVIVEEVQREGKKFLSVFDVKDLKGDKVYKKLGLSGPDKQPVSGGTASGQYNSTIDKKNIPSSITDVKLKKSISHGLYLLRKSRPLHGRLNFNGLQISIENRKGSIRQWHDPHEGRDGMTRMSIPYGYIQLTQGMDGDHVACFC